MANTGKILTGRELLEHRLDALERKQVLLTRALLARKAPKDIQQQRKALEEKARKLQVQSSMNAVRAGFERKEAWRKSNHLS